MTTVYKYRVYCSTDSQYEYVWGETEPTTCPTNTAHTITSSKTAIVETNVADFVTIKEEIVPTGGHFGCSTICINAAGNDTSSTTISWPFQISALSIEFATKDEHEGDLLSMCVGKDTIIGAIGANLPLEAAWVSQNYTEGQIVTYQNKKYECSTNTVSNEAPSDTSYWTYTPLQINVAQTVIDNTAVGFYISLFDGNGTSDELGRVVAVDDGANTIDVEFVNSVAYSAASPTYVRNTVYQLKNYKIGPAWERTIGSNKIGGSSIPANIPVTVNYANHGTTDKIFIGAVEYLY